jgi:hypothetical protein
MHRRRFSHGLKILGEINFPPYTIAGHNNIRILPCGI